MKVKVNYYNLLKVSVYTRFKKESYFNYLNSKLTLRNSSSANRQDYINEIMIMKKI